MDDKDEPKHNPRFPAPTRLLLPGRRYAHRPDERPGGHAVLRPVDERGGGGQRVGRVHAEEQGVLRGRAQESAQRGSARGDSR